MSQTLNFLVSISHMLFNSSIHQTEIQVHVIYNFLYEALTNFSIRSLSPLQYLFFESGRDPGMSNGSPSNGHLGFYSIIACILVRIISHLSLSYLIHLSCVPKFSFICVIPSTYHNTVDIKATQ